MMTSKQRAFLKKEGHKLEPLVRIGKEGLTENIVTSLLDVITSRELVKVKVLANLEVGKDELRAIAEDLAKKSDSELVGIIGKILMFYKENKEKPVVSLKLKGIK